MNLKDMLSNNHDKLHLGGAFWLWDMCRHRIVGLPVLDLFYELTEDPDLKNVIKYGIESLTIPHIEKIEKFLEDEKLALPQNPQRKKLDDQQIALVLMEIMRLSLINDNMSLMNTTREDLRKFIWDITVEDKKSFDKIVELGYKKNWLINPPSA